MTGGPIRWRFAVGLVTAGVPLVGGCPPCRAPEAAPLAAGDFERCEDATCRFEAVAGAARSRSTFHPGERALELGADSVVRASPERAVSPTESSLSLSLLARCDDGTTLSARLATLEGLAPPPAEKSREDGVRATADWERARVSFGPNRTNTRLRALRRETRGPGRCGVDQLTVSVLTPGTRE